MTDPLAGTLEKLRPYLRHKPECHHATDPTTGELVNAYRLLGPCDCGLEQSKKKRPPMLHFHDGRSLTVWCGRSAKLANWATRAAWVTCAKCRRMIEERS